MRLALSFAAVKDAYGPLLTLYSPSENETWSGSPGDFNSVFNLRKKLAALSRAVNAPSCK